MKGTLADFQELRNLKKKLSASKPEEEKTPVENRRDRTVKNKTRAEYKAVSEGITIGMKVKMMDSTDCGIIRGFSDNGYEIECDGITFTAQRSEFVPAPHDEEVRMMETLANRKKKKEEEKKSRVTDMTVDLHLEQIPGSYGVPEWAALDYQMNYFRQILNDNLHHRGMKITFIHGIGDGTLSKAVRKELDEAYAISCIYSYGVFGSTVVTIK